MNAKLLRGINALLAILFAAMGFNSCVIRCKYGVPNVEMDVSGTVTNEEKQPIEGIQVTIKAPYGWPIIVYTQADGYYMMNMSGWFPEDSIDIIATDTAGVYEKDSVRVSVVYDPGEVSQNDSWYQGVGIVKQNFELKKKD